MANFPTGPIPFDKDNPLQRRTPNGLVRVFIGTDGLLYRRDEEGVDHLIDGSGGGGGSWDPIAGPGITITPSGLDYIFSATGNVTTQNITADLAVGAIEAGEVVPAGSGLQDFITQLITATFYPTFTSPSFSLTTNLAAKIEIGTINDVTLTASFDRGSINGALNVGIWNPMLFQNYRSGAATLYMIGGVGTGTTPSRVINNYQIIPGTNVWSATVNYSSGPQPTDSDGSNYSAPLSSGSLNDNSNVTEGVRKYFFGTYSTTAAPSSSADIRGLSNFGLDASNGTDFSLSIPIGAEIVIFAYPATLNDVSSVKYVEGMYAEVKGIFTQTTISVQSANGYDAINYRVYYYVPVEPFSQIATYEVTI